MGKGYVMLSKELMDSEDYFLERFTRMQAYMDLCLLASFKERKFVKRGQIIELKAGQLAKSEEELAQRWKWSRNTVRKYLNEQQNIGNIEQQKSRLITIITVKFGLISAQQFEQQTPHFFEQQIEQQQEIIYNNDKELNNKEEDTKVSEKKEKSDIEKIFEQFRLKYKKYGGKVRGFQTELDDLKKKHKDWKEIIYLLDTAIERENMVRTQANARREFFPRIQNLKTYLNQRSWEAYVDSGNDNLFHIEEDYHPIVDNISQWWDEKRKCLIFNGYTNMIHDGYTDETRPDGAKAAHNMYVWIWSKSKKQWIQQ